MIPAEDMISSSSEELYNDWAGLNVWSDAAKGLFGLFVLEVDSSKPAFLGMYRNSSALALEALPLNGHE
jgi:hypothetical protein